MRVLVTGATGFVGGRLVPELVDRGHEVVALVRDATAYDPPNGVAVVEGDLLEPATIDPAFVVDGEPVDAAFYLVHSMGGAGDFERKDRLAATAFRDAADAAGVKRVVYLGGLGADRDSLSPHLRSRREVEHVLADGTYDLTTLRAAMIVGAGSASFDIVRQLAGRLPVMITPLWVRTSCQPIAIADVVAALVGVLERPETAGETYEIGGPEVMTYEEVLRRTRRQMGHRLVVVPVPLLTPKLSAYWLAFVTDVPTTIARPLVEGLRNPVVVEDDRLRLLLNREPTPFDLAVARALAGSDDPPASPGRTVRPAAADGDR